jgi:hypothetical protein
VHGQYTWWRGKIGAGLFVAGLALTLIAGGGCENGGGAGMELHGDEEVWAIRCATLTGPERFTQADNLATALKTVKGLRAELVQVVHEDDGSTIYYGRYRRRYGETNPKRQFDPSHLKSLEIIRNLVVQGARVQPFMLASMDVLPTFDSAHPEWDLTTVDGHWSLQVGVFYNTKTMRSRRSAAEQYCAVLRARGEDAYFHHGVVNSSVCIGIYPVGAVTEVRRENPFSGDVTMISRIADPQMLAAQERYPVCLHNGHEMHEVIRDPKTRQVIRREPYPSFPVLLPRAQALRDSGALR